MNREIKFRAWYKPEKYMTYPTDIDFMAETVTVTTKESFVTCDYGHDQDRAILMQYTGLKDKNGVEIYEGDIVSTLDGTARTVEWGFTSSDGEALGYAVYGVDEDVKVLGNIYENPELLQDNSEAQV